MRALAHSHIFAHTLSLVKVNDEKTIFMFGFRTAFGGGKRFTRTQTCTVMRLPRRSLVHGMSAHAYSQHTYSTGFCLIYDSLNDALNIEPKYRLIRVCLLSTAFNHLVLLGVL